MKTNRKPASAHFAAFRKAVRKTAVLAAASLMMAGCTDSSEKANTENGPSEMPVIGLVQLIDQTSLNTIREAMLDEFDQLGYTDGETVRIDYQNAAGKQANLQSIASQFAGENADVMVAIATGAAQSCQNYSDEIPLVFSAVADPVSAGLVKDPDHPEGNITGTSFGVNVSEILDLIAEMDPEAETIGCLYTPGEVNGVSTLNRFREEARKRGYQIVEETGTDLTTLQQAEDALLEKCDVLFSPNDNIVASGMSALAEAAIAAGIAYYSAADSMVQDGSLATVGIDYEELGRETARMTVSILEGEKPENIPVKKFETDLSTYINTDTLARLNRTLPETTASRKKLREFS